MRRMALVAVLLPLVVMTSCRKGPQANDPIVIGFAPSLTSALEIVAQTKGFFAAEGINAEMVTFPSGRLAMDGLLAGKVGLASSATFPFVTNSFVRDDLRIVATTAICGNDNQIVARKDSGITRLPDLRGKRIGVAKGSTTKYVLDLLLVENGLSDDEVTEVDASPDEIHAQLIENKLDAVCTLGLWVEKAREGLGDNAIVFSDETLMRITTILSATKAWIEAEPQVLARVLKAYLRAEDFLRRNPEESFKLVTEYLGHTREPAHGLWQPHMYRVALDQSLLVDLEGLARWQMAKGMTQSKTLPNYLKSIHFATLESLAPDRVKIVH